ncbi:MAG: ATP-binding protein, partial [bacterium]|nr:ATP-binding protein [bacterium]
GMRQEFIGRQRELELLENAYRAQSSAFIPIYGRRRIGKSELILHFTANRPSLYYLGKQAKPGLQMREFLAVAADLFDEPLLATMPATNWRDILTTVTDRWQAQPSKLVIVLDEFQWMVGASPELPSVIQELWDRRWRDSGQVLLILCGSFIGFMEREVLGRKSPLFGRRTAQILLRPFGFREARRFHASYSLVDAARTYFVCGGIPLYLLSFDSQRSFETNLHENFLSEYAPLFREPDFLLREELREVGNYYAILMALASGSAANRQIAKRAGISEQKLSYYLAQLLDLGYLGRRYPLTGASPVARDVRYALEDPLLRFWFRFVYPNTSLIMRWSPAKTFASRVRPGLDSYLGLCFERLCREALPYLYEQEGVDAAFEVGEYWDANTQIDLVGLRDDGWTDLGECRWGSVRSPKAVARELTERKSRYPNPRNATIALRAFVRRTPAGASQLPIRWHDLADLYGETTEE